MTFKPNTLRLASLLAVLTLASQLSAKTAAYETDFSGLISDIDYQKCFGITLGGDSVPADFKVADFNLWGITINGNDFSGGFARPQKRPATNVKMMGVFLDPGLFDGPGRYTINFDLTSDPDGDPAFRAFVFEGSGYDLKWASEDRIDLSLSAPGFLVYVGLTAEGDAVARELAAAILDFEATAGTVDKPETSAISIKFTYDGSSTIAFSVGGYNNASTINNFKVVKESGF